MWLKNGQCLPTNLVIHRIHCLCDDALARLVKYTLFEKSSITFSDLE